MKKNEDQFDIPEGVDWSWTGEHQDEMMQLAEKEAKEKKERK